MILYLKDKIEELIKETRKDMNAIRNLNPTTIEGKIKHSFDKGYYGGKLSTLTKLLIILDSENE
jgi:hypothetical protein